MIPGKKKCVADENGWMAKSAGSATPHPLQWGVVEVPSEGVDVDDGPVVGSAVAGAEAWACEVLDVRDDVEREAAGVVHAAVARSRATPRPAARRPVARPVPVQADPAIPGDDSWRPAGLAPRP